MNCLSRVTLGSGAAERLIESALMPGYVQYGMFLIGFEAMWEGRHRGLLLRASSRQEVGNRG